MTDTSPYERMCPSCHAPRHQPCRSLDGNLMRLPHAVRYKHYEATESKWELDWSRLGIFFVAFIIVVIWVWAMVALAVEVLE